MYIDTCTPKNSYYTVIHGNVLQSIYIYLSLYITGDGTETTTLWHTLWHRYSTLPQDKNQSLAGIT